MSRTPHSQVVPYVGCALSVMLAAALWARAPETVVAHYGTDGPDRWVSGRQGIVEALFVAAVGLVLTLGVAWVPRVRAGSWADRFGAATLAGVPCWIAAAMLVVLAPWSDAQRVLGCWLIAGLFAATAWYAWRHRPR